MKKISKQHVFILGLFLLFFPIKTQFYNLIYIVFDTVLNSGGVSSIYRYNYLGFLLGCQEILETQNMLGVRFEFFNSVVYYFLLILSLTASIILFKRIRTRQNFKYVDWILLVVFSFQLFDTLEQLLNYILIPEYFALDTSSNWISYLKNLVIIIIAFTLFFKVFNLHIRKQIFMYALPASILSFLIWFFVLGPLILPIITL